MGPTDNPMTSVRGEGSKCERLMGTIGILRGFRGLTEEEAGHSVVINSKGETQELRLSEPFVEALTAVFCTFEALESLCFREFLTNTSGGCGYSTHTRGTL